MPRKLQKTKYIFVSGGVLSSLGKGITTSSLAMLLQTKGYAVTVVKCENYLNIDSGLINPLEHGDAFLCEDGTETDMDLGNYERFLGKNLGSHNFITMGQIYKAVIDRERENGYGGEDIEAIPHVTDEIPASKKAEKDQAEICLELGTAEYQNVLYYSQSDQEAAGDSRCPFTSLPPHSRPHINPRPNPPSFRQAAQRHVYPA
jgi:CTP synthase